MQLLNKKLINQRFNRSAKAYDQAAFVQREVGQRLIERLDDIKLSPSYILDLGCGTGKNLFDLAKRYPAAQVCGVDFATAMLAHSSQQSTFSHVAADVTQLPFADNSVDLLFSNLMLQWCDPLQPAIQECYRVLREGGLLLFATFGPDTLQELRYSWAQIDQYPHINRFIDMHHIGDLLLQQKFNDPVMDMEYITASYKDVNNILRDLQSIGSINSHPERRKTLTGKKLLTELAKYYQQFALEDKRLPLTYEIVYGHAWKFKANTKQNPTEAYIAIEDIKR
jgi:malonyl-CoA O-methyltransferase